MPTRTRAVPPTLEGMSENIPKIFEQVQSSIANHQKNYVALNKIHTEAAAETKTSDDGESVQLIGEKAFEDVFIDLLLRVLPVKKGANVVDRVVKFVAGYVKFVNEKTKAIRNEQSNTNEEEEEGTPATRFIERLVKYLLKGFESKDKNVRFRVLQLTAEIAPSIEFIEASLFDDLHEALHNRVHDKEAQVRTQAIVALSNCYPLALNAANCDEDLAVFEDVLRRDTAAEVRKATLLNMPLSPATMESILSRTRDPDASVRRAVYEGVLNDSLGHPNLLSIAQREAVVRCGLRDRDSSVKAAASNLLGGWLDKVEGSLTDFVELFDYDHIDAPDWLTDPDLAFAPAEKALLSIYDSRKDVLETLEFKDTFWRDLNPTQALIARVFVDHCLLKKNESLIEESMPVMTALAFKVQSLFNDLMEKIQIQRERQLFEDVVSVDEDEAVEQVAFVLQEVLKLCMNLDSGDEIGRRKLFALVKDMTSQDMLPERLLPYCLDILRKFSSGERDLIRVVVEVIHDLRDADRDDEDMQGQGPDDSNGVEDTPMPVRTPKPIRRLEDMTPEDKETAKLMDLRCLSLCIGMLERVNSTFEENSTLEGVLGELILPAVRSRDIVLREKGFICLGLCCLIARHMALTSFKLFLEHIKGTPETFKVRILHIVFDIMMVHENDLLANTDVGGDKVVEFLRQIFEADESQRVQAAICNGLAKLMLSGMVTDERVLVTLVVAYMSPYFAENQQVRQCLSYFFPVYCYSSSANQRRIQKNFMEIFNGLNRISKEVDGDDGVSPLQVVSLLVDWTDPERVMEIRGDAADKYVHYDLAVQIVKALFNKELEKEEKKVFCQILGKLYIPPDIDDDKIRTLKLLVNNISQRRKIKDATSRNAFNRFDASLSKNFATQLENLNEEEYRKLEELKDLFEFLDDIFSDDSDEEVEPPKRGTRKRRSDSITTTTATEMTVDEETQEYRAKSKGKGSASKRRRISNTSNATETDDDEIASLQPTRAMPRRAATRDVGIIEEIPDSASEAEMPPPPSRSSRPTRKILANRRTTEERIDADIDDLLSSDSEDSIMDVTKSDIEPEHEDDEEAANEVDDLL